MQRVWSLPSIAARRPDTHKGTYGRVLVIAGSATMPGAAVLAARAALRAGAGLVTAAIPPSIAGVLGAAVPEATQLHLPEPGASDVSRRLEQALRERLEAGADAVAIGPGLGVAESTRALLELTFARSAAPVVIDADGLNTLAAHPEMRPAHRERSVWTPHPGEFERLCGEKPRGESQRVEACGRFADRFGGVVVLKGHGTVVFEKGRFYVNTTGNPGMATGGAGDVLTGVIAAFIAQGITLFEAAALAAHIHGAAGDLAALALGEMGMIAGDIVDRLPEALERYQHPGQSPSQRSSQHPQQSPGLHSQQPAGLRSQQSPGQRSQQQP